MIVQEDDGYWLILKETIARHHEDVFACLTTAGGLMQWFPVSAEIDLREGGLVVLGWDQKLERKSTFAIIQYDAGGRIAWDWYADEEGTHAPVYWSVEPDREQGAKVILRQGPFGSDEESLISMAEEAETWRWYLCNMRSVLEAKHDMRRVRPM